MIGSEPSSPPRTPVHQRADVVADGLPVARDRGRGSVGGCDGAHADDLLGLAGHLRQRAGGDGLDDLALGDVLRRELGDVLAEPQDRDPVGDLEDVVQVVRDEHDAEALLAQALDEVEHLAGLRDAERRGRLVEDDELASST